MSRPKEIKLSAPVTRKSSKAELWEEIKAMEREIASQQKSINAKAQEAKSLRLELDEVKKHLRGALIRLKVIREAVSDLGV